MYPFRDVEELSDKLKRADDNASEVTDLHAKIGKLAAENDFLSQGLKR